MAWTGLEISITDNLVFLSLAEGLFMQHLLSRALLGATYAAWCVSLCLKEEDSTVTWLHLASLLFAQPAVWQLCQQVT